jgi:hypothetical protein
MDKKNLIVSGCSFTTGHNLHQKGSWAFHLSNMLELKLHNLARGGMGNQFIANSIIGYLTTNKELISNSIVIVAWSEITRGLGTFTTPSNGNVELVTIRPQDFIMDDSKNDWNKDIDAYHGYTLKNSDIISPYFSSWNYRIYETYVAMLHLKTFLELNKIPYLFFDAINDNKVVFNESPIKKTTITLTNTFETINLNEPIETFMSSILNNKVLDRIFNDENYISFYGKSMGIHMQSDPLKYEKYTQGNDGHPNEYASNYYAKIILNEYERLYNKR